MGRHERGVGLVEIMMALSLLSVVMMALGALMFQVGRHTRLSAQVAYRSAALNSAASWAQAMPWDSIPNLVGWGVNDTIGQLIFQRYMSYATSGNNRVMTLVIRPVTTVASSARVKPETLTVVRTKPLTTAPLKVR
jgi:hypothetical protein